MPAVTIRLTGELRPGRGDGRRGAGSRVRPAAPLDPDRRQRLGTPGRRSTSNRRDCRSGRGGRAVRPRESRVRTRGRGSGAPPVARSAADWRMTSAVSGRDGANGPRSISAQPSAPTPVDGSPR